VHLASRGRRSARTTDGRHGRRGGAAGGRRLHSGCPIPAPLHRTGIRWSVRRSRGVHGAGRGRGAHSRRGPRSGCGRPIHAIPGSGNRDRPDAGPSAARTIAQPTGSSTNPRGSDGSHEAGDRRRRIAEFRSPASSPRGTARCRASDIRACDLPIEDRSCRGNCCRPVVDQRCPCCRHGIRDRRNGIRRDCCDIRRGRRGGRPVFRRGIHPRRSGPQKWVARGIRGRPCGIPSCFRSSGRHDCRTGCRNRRGRRGRGGPVDPSGVGPRRCRGNRLSGPHLAGRPWAGRPAADRLYVGRRRGRSSCGRPGRRRPGDRRVGRRADRRQTCRHGGRHCDDHRGCRARHRHDAVRKCRTDALRHRRNDRLRHCHRYLRGAPRSARPDPSEAGPRSVGHARRRDAPGARRPADPRRRHDGSSPSRCRPCPSRRLGPIRHGGQQRFDRRDPAYFPNSGRFRAPLRDHYLADGYRRNHPRYSCGQHTPRFCRQRKRPPPNGGGLFSYV